MITTSSAIVGEQHIDEYGHMNHALGLRILEWARDDWYRQAGLWGGRPWSEDERLGTIVLNLNVNYRAECFEGDEVTVLTVPQSRGSKSFILYHELKRADGEIAIDGTCTSLIMDLKARQTLPLPDSLAACFSAAS